MWPKIPYFRDFGDFSDFSAILAVWQKKALENCQSVDTESRDLTKRRIKFMFLTQNLAKCAIKFMYLTQNLVI